MYLNRPLIKQKIKEKGLTVNELAQKCYPNHLAAFQSFSDLLNHRRNYVNFYCLGVLTNELDLTPNELLIFEKK